MSILTKILKYFREEKPILKLTPLEKTAVHSQTQEECDELMRVYEIGGWKWADGGLPTKNSSWIEEICFDAKENFTYSDKDFYLKSNYKVISTQEFYNIQKITPERIKEMNKYFEKRK